jgi:acetate kinase
MRILAINSGSSSLKFALYELGSDEERLLSGSISGIGLTTSTFRATDGNGRTLADHPATIAKPSSAVDILLAWLEENSYRESLTAVGYRIVHGGPHYRQPQYVTAELLEELHDLCPTDPEHMPQALRIVQTMQETYPEVKHVVCFDTAFHRDMPAVAQTVALPRSVRDGGVMRYGFHGLSYEFVTEQLGSGVSGNRVIIAHLGNGASMVAVKDGKSVETTMGFSPTSGLVMSTRCGDIDPSIVLYLLRHARTGPEEINQLLNKQGGLLGVSGFSSDMRELLEQEQQNADAALAVKLFCYQARKFIGALAATLEGLDRLVFTGGIGENAPVIRERVCRGLGFLGVDLDERRNLNNESTISTEDSWVTIQVVKTNEELMIARHVQRLLG